MVNAASDSSQNERKVFWLSVCLALVTEFAVIGFSGMHFIFPTVAPPHQDVPDAEIVTLPDEEPHLVSAQAPAKAAPEETLSEKKTNAAPSAKSLSEPTSNQVQKGKPLSATHGPVLIDSPSPVIPDYLKSQDINAKVVIEFSVFASGEVSPRLLVSSGNEELDQIAIATAKKWKFYPAENAHKAIDAKVRLRILFEVK
jgi:TonB family protein